MCDLVVLIIGTNEEHIKVKSRTKFAVNTMNTQGVISIYSCKKREQSSVMATG